MGLSLEQLRDALAQLAAAEPAVARALSAVGHPAPRISARGYATLLRTIAGQQVSVASADAVIVRLRAALGDIDDPHRLLAASDEILRAAGLSRQKAGYARSLAQAIVGDTLDLTRLPEDDEAAIAELVRVKGIGRWSAEIYLLVSEGRADSWPAGDLAVQVAVADMLGLDRRPTEPALRALAERWRPHRGAMAILAWHHYGVRARRSGTATPL